MDKLYCRKIDNLTGNMGISSRNQEPLPKIIKFLIWLVCLLGYEACCKPIGKAKKDAEAFTRRLRS